MIAEVGPGIVPGEATNVVDGAGGYLMPGLWDSHVHIFSSPNEPDTALPLYLLHGISGIRNMDALRPIEEQQALQARIEAGKVLVPRLIPAGAWVDAAPGSWPGMFLADTPAKARAIVDRIAEEDWAAVKAYSMLDEPTYLALAEAAHDADLPLVGHILERVALATAVAAGQEDMEHLGRVAMACSPAEAEMTTDLRETMAEGADQVGIFAVMAARNRVILETWDEALCTNVLEKLAASGMCVSSTKAARFDETLRRFAAERAGGTIR